MRYDDVQIKEFRVENGGVITILRGGLNKPKSYMDNIVSEYVGDVIHNQFIEIFLDNPYVRVIVSGINDFDYDVFDTEVFHL
jgi:hypothetical protein